MKCAIPGPVAFAANFMQLLQQLVKLIEILQPDDVFFFDLLVRFLRRPFSMADSEKARKIAHEFCPTFLI